MVSAEEIVPAEDVRFGMPAANAIHFSSYRDDQHRNRRAVSFIVHASIVHARVLLCQHFGVSSASAEVFS